MKLCITSHIIISTSQQMRQIKDPFTLFCCYSFVQFTFHIVRKQVCYYLYVLLINKFFNTCNQMFINMLHHQIYINVCIVVYYNKLLISAYNSAVVAARHQFIPERYTEININLFVTILHVQEMLLL